MFKNEINVIYVIAPINLKNDYCYSDLKVNTEFGRMNSSQNRAELHKIAKL